ncbi:MAG: winged helix DNA-binding protein [Bacteroidota bacterium]
MKQTNVKAVESLMRLGSVLSAYFSAKEIHQHQQGFSKLQIQVLRFVQVNPNLTQEDIIKLIPQSDIAVRRAVRKLGRERYLFHNTASDDKELTIQITPRGTELLSGLEQMDIHLAEHILEMVPEERKEEFVASIETAASLLSPKVA